MNRLIPSIDEPGREVAAGYFVDLFALAICLAGWVMNA